MERGKGAMELLWGVEGISWAPWDKGSMPALPLHGLIMLCSLPRLCRPAALGACGEAGAELREKGRVVMMGMEAHSDGMSSWPYARFAEAAFSTPGQGGRGTSSLMTFTDTLPPARPQKSSFWFLPSHSFANALTRADHSAPAPPRPTEEEGQV